jgi:hypothetical protein
MTIMLLLISDRHTVSRNTWRLLSKGREWNLFVSGSNFLQFKRAHNEGAEKHHHIRWERVNVLIALSPKKWLLLCSTSDNQVLDYSSVQVCRCRGRDASYPVVRKWATILKPASEVSSCFVLVVKLYDCWLLRSKLYVLY